MIDEATITAALDEARAIVQADGGDMQLAGVDGTTVNLRLVLEGASCAECVMPREFLEQIVLDMLKKQAPAVSAVHIDDPREHPDWVPSDH
ncbi:MAG TPA: NifU family protein [Acidimicrobiales bacterium]